MGDNDYIMEHRESISLRKEEIDKHRRAWGHHISDKHGELTALLKKEETEVVELHDDNITINSENFVLPSRLPSTHHLPNPDPSAKPKKSIMKKRVKDPQPQTLGTSEDKGVWWADDPETQEPLHTEHYIPHWNRKSNFASRLLKATREAEWANQKICVIIACICGTICLGVMITLFIVLRLGQSHPDDDIPIPQPAPM